MCSAMRVELQGVISFFFLYFFLIVTRLPCDLLSCWQIWCMEEIWRIFPKKKELCFVLVMGLRNKNREGGFPFSKKCAHLNFINSCERQCQDCSMDCSEEYISSQLLPQMKRMKQWDVSVLMLITYTKKETWEGWGETGLNGNMKKIQDLFQAHHMLTS